MPPDPPSTSDRRVLWTCIYFVIATLALIHPIFTYVGNRIEPRLMGLPFSTVYVLLWIGLNSFVLTWMYRSRLLEAEEKA